MVKKLLFLMGYLTWMPLYLQDINPNDIHAELTPHKEKSSILKRVIVSLSLAMGCITLGYFEWDNYKLKQNLQDLKDKLDQTEKDFKKRFDSAHEESQSKIDKLEQDKERAHTTIKKIGTLILNQRTLKTNFLELKEIYFRLKEDIKKDYGFQYADDEGLQTVMGKNLKDFENKLQNFSAYFEKREMILPVTGEEPPNDDR